MISVVSAVLGQLLASVAIRFPWAIFLLIVLGAATAAVMLWLIWISLLDTIRAD